MFINMKCELLGSINNKYNTSAKNNTFNTCIVFPEYCVSFSHGRIKHNQKNKTSMSLIIIDFNFAVIH